MCRRWSTGRAGARSAALRGPVAERRQAPRPRRVRVEEPNEPTPDHFGLAVDDYTHATAPNRRFADLVTQRLVKAALTGRQPPHSHDELAAIAQRCMDREDA